MFDFRKIMGYYSMEHPALDATTTFYEFLSYQECCWSLNRPVSLTSFMRYNDYLKEIGVK